MNVKSQINTKKRKTAAAVTATALAAAIMLTGTYAWQSISQTALNEVMSNNPGGRLHDDFNGTNKDVYVENFGDKPIYARIRLDEYIELGKGAGSKTEQNPDVIKIEGTDINDVNTWQTHIPGGTGNKCITTVGEVNIHDYWTWEMGGSTVYMPTFNKNKDSLKSELNGTLEGTVTGDDIYYDDYKTYKEGQKVTGNEVYDIDSNTVDEVNPVEGENIQTVENVEHTAKSSLDAKVITMEEWKELGSPIGNYWVYDTDGWAYWAAPVEPGTATGLLLSGITTTNKLPLDYYYGINVVSQFATEKDIETCFTKPTDEAKILLNRLTEKYTSVTVSSKSGSNTVKKGTDIEFKADSTITEGAATTTVENIDNVRWIVVGATTEGTSINADGILTVSDDEPGDTVLTVKAISKYNVEGKMEVTVISDESGN